MSVVSYNCPLWLQEKKAKKLPTYNSIELWHMCSSVSNDISHNSIHRWFWRVNVRITNHEPIHVHQ